MDHSPAGQLHQRTYEARHLGAISLERDRLNNYDGVRATRGARILVMTLSVLGLSLLVMRLGAMPNPRRAFIPPPIDAPGVRYRCWCHDAPTDVVVVPQDAVVVLPSGRYTRPSRSATPRHRVPRLSSSRPGNAADGREDDIPRR